MMIASPAISQPYHVKDGRLSLDFHRGQWQAWDSTARFVVVLAGTQGGKTSWGPHWLYREIKQRGAGDYLVVTPTYPLLNLKALPEFLHIFETLLGLGHHKKAEKVFQFDATGEIRTWGKEQEHPTRILFGYATDPESLESATAKAAWLDEAGQNKFKLASFEAIMRRLSLAQGRILITTTPYNLGWLKQKFWDKRHEDDSIDVIRFDSTENPSFPPEEMERARRDLPRWKFDMFYRAIFTRPAGMIYDCFDEGLNKIARFDIPPDWPRYVGLDFGGVNTAAVFLASKPGTDTYYVYQTYKAGGKTAKEHGRSIHDIEPRIAYTVGGSKSEGQWRSEFGAGGLPVGESPVTAVDVGIDRVYGAIKRRELVIFDDLDDLSDEVMSYARELDDMGEPTEKIADKAAFHLLDAVRYICSRLFSVSNKLPDNQPAQPSKWGRAEKIPAVGRWKKF